MRKFFFPEQDTTLYSEYPTGNTGFDEILEIGKTGGTYPVRSLIQFDLSSLGVVPSGSKFDLVLYVANATNLKHRQEIHVSPVVSEWEGGSGYFAQDIIQDTDGATWTLRKNGVTWPSNAAPDVSGSQASVVLMNPVTDLAIDVTDIVTTWLSGSVNNGVVVAFPSGSEVDTNNVGNVKVFSNETKTIYRPTLVMKWDDQIRVTGSLAATPSSSLICTPATLRSQYRVGEVARIDVSVREQSPTRTFSNVFNAYDGKRYLPATAYYSIVDDLSGAVIIPFDEYSKISCDANGAYFTFRVENMYANRYYRVMLKVEHDGLIEVFDCKYAFKVVN